MCVFVCVWSAELSINVVAEVESAAASEGFASIASPVPVRTKFTPTPLSDEEVDRLAAELFEGTSLGLLVCVSCLLF